MRHEQLRLVSRRPLRHPAENHRCGDRRGIVHIVRTGQIEDRLAQLGRPADRLVHRIETGNPPQKDLAALRLRNGVKHHPAEEQRQHQVVHRVPVEPVGSWDRMKQWTDRSLFTLEHRHGHCIRSPVFQPDTLPVPDNKLVPVPFCRPCPPGALEVSHQVSLSRELGNDIQ
jgi:hypothetical protein